MRQRTALLSATAAAAKRETIRRSGVVNYFAMTALKNGNVAAGKTTWRDEKRQRLYVVRQSELRYDVALLSNLNQAENPPKVQNYSLSTNELLADSLLARDEKLLLNVRVIRVRLLFIIVVRPITNALRRLLKKIIARRWRSF